MFGIDDAIIAPVVGSLASGFMNNMFANSRQEDSQQFSAAQYATRYQTQVADLKQAGLNPMLAYTHGPGASPTSSPASSAGFGDLGNTISQAKLASAQEANIRADTSNKQASADLIQAQISDTLASAQQKGEFVNQVQATTKKILQETENLKSENVRIEATIHNLAEHTALMRQQGKTESQRTLQIRGIVEQLRLENAITQADYNAMIKTDFVGRLAREVKPVADITTDVMDSLKFWKGKTRRETGTTYDRHGRESGGYSRETHER